MIKVTDLYNYLLRKPPIIFLLVSNITRCVQIKNESDHLYPVRILPF